MKARWLLLVALVLLSACSGKNTQTQELSEQQYYQEAQKALDNNNFLIAIDRLRQLEGRYPFGVYAEQAQLEIMYAHYKMSDLPSVLAVSERFIRLHPLHPNVDYAYYLRGVATYEMGFSFIDRYFNDGNMERDPTPLRDAFQHFNDLLLRYPDSQYATDAQARMIHIKQRLASHEISVAQFQMKRHSFIAAANRASHVIATYPRTPAVADALALQVEAYRQLQLLDEADQALALLTLNFPEHAQLRNGRFVDSGLAEIDRRSFLNVVTFGLL